METQPKGRAVLVDGEVFERLADGSLRPFENRTDFQRLDRMTDAEVEAAAEADADGLPMSDDEWARVAITLQDKVPVGLKLDRDVLDWFKSNGRGYQTRINAVLRTYMDAHRKVG